MIVSRCNFFLSLFTVSATAVTVDTARRYLRVENLKDGRTKVENLAHGLSDRLTGGQVATKYSEEENHIDEESHSDEKSAGEKLMSEVLKVNERAKERSNKNFHKTLNSLRGRSSHKRNAHHHSKRKSPHHHSNGKSSHYHSNRNARSHTSTNRNTHYHSDRNARSHTSTNRNARSRTSTNRNAHHHSNGISQSFLDKSSQGAADEISGRKVALYNPYYRCLLQLTPEEELEKEPESQQSQLGNSETLGNRGGGYVVTKAGWNSQERMCNPYHFTNTAELLEQYPKAAFYVQPYPNSAFSAHHSRSGVHSSHSSAKQRYTLAVHINDATSETATSETDEKENTNANDDTTRYLSFSNCDTSTDSSNATSTDLHNTGRISVAADGSVLPEPEGDQLSEDVFNYGGGDQHDHVHATKQGDETSQVETSQEECLKPHKWIANEAGLEGPSRVNDRAPDVVKFRSGPLPGIASGLQNHFPRQKLYEIVFGETIDSKLLYLPKSRVSVGNKELMLGSVPAPASSSNSGTAGGSSSNSETASSHSPTADSEGTSFHVHVRVDDDDNSWNDEEESTTDPFSSLYAIEGSGSAFRGKYWHFAENGVVEGEEEEDQNQHFLIFDLDSNPTNGPTSDPTNDATTSTSNLERTTTETTSTNADPTMESTTSTAQISLCATLPDDKFYLKTIVHGEYRYCYLKVSRNYDEDEAEVRCQYDDKEYATEFQLTSDARGSTSQTPQNMAQSMAQNTPQNRIIVGFSDSSKNDRDNRVERRQSRIDAGLKEELEEGVVDTIHSDAKKRYDCFVEYEQGDSNNSEYSKKRAMCLPFDALNEIQNPVQPTDNGKDAVDNDAQHKYDSYTQLNRKYLQAGGNEVGVYCDMESQHQVVFGAFGDKKSNCYVKNGNLFCDRNQKITSPPTTFILEPVHQEVADVPGSTEGPPTGAKTSPPQPGNSAPTSAPPDASTPTVSPDASAPTTAPLAGNSPTSAPPGNSSPKAAPLAGNAPTVSPNASTPTVSPGASTNPTPPPDASTPTTVSPGANAPTSAPPDASAPTVSPGASANPTPPSGTGGAETTTPSPTDAVKSTDDGGPQPLNKVGDHDRLVPKTTQEEEDDKIAKHGGLNNGEGYKNSEKKSA